MKRFIVTLALVFSFSFLTAASAAPVFFDDFNAEHGGVGVLNYTGFAKWTVSGGTVDLIGNGYFDFLPGNGLYVDMDGSTGNAGKMTSKDIFLLAGQYSLSFDLAGNHRNTAQETVIAQVAIGTLLNKNYSLPQTAPFTTYTETFTVASDMTVALSFEGLGGDNIGMLLDDVSLTRVPEPSTFFLFGLGLIGLVGLRKKILK